MAIYLKRYVSNLYSAVKLITVLAKKWNLALSKGKLYNV